MLNKEQSKMKRLLYILTFCLAVGAAQAIPTNDNTFMQQRTEATTVSSAIGGAGYITLTAGTTDATFNIYTITGQLFKVVRVSAEQRTTVDVPKGFYIVKCGNQWSRKVVVK